MKSLQGHFLVASPQLLDPNFFHTVVLIVQHDENGAVGLVLNRPTEMSISDAWKQVSENPYENADLVHQGGPCEGPLMVLHTTESASQVEVLPGVYYDTDASSVSWLVEQRIEPIRFFVGYAGWEGTQLDQELAEAAWLVIPATAAAIFSPPADHWATLMKLMTRHTVTHNINPKLIPVDPSRN